MNPTKCPLCVRVLVDDRPLCNTHLRRVGDGVATRYFALRRSAERAELIGDPRPARQLADLKACMIANARAYDTIRNTGFRPVWDKAGQRWTHPRERAREIILKHYPHLNVGTVDHLGAMIAELIPLGS